ncbi:MAG: response regulator [Lachnospiraceae bacterium]|nr:response regulator [Lachnospiraceae bacterium]
MGIQIGERELTLLIVDDEDTIRKGMQKYIELHSDRFDRIMTASNGAEALDLIYKFQPDIMLLDIQMPVKDGIEVMQEAGDAGVLPKTIVLTSYDEFSYAQAALKAGAVDYILKPSRSSDILDKVYNIANRFFKDSDAEDRAPGYERRNDNYFVSEAVKIIEREYYMPLSLEDVAEKVDITPGYLSSLFSKHMNICFIDYLNRVRVDHACIYLAGHSLKTYEIAYKVGFKDDKYFYRVFKKNKGMTPSEYRKSFIKEGKEPE